MNDPIDTGLVIGPRWLERDRAEGDDRPLRWPEVHAPPATSAGIWTLLGNLGAPGQLDAPRAAVDTTGLVGPSVDGWTLDWWIGAEDRWHLPSREAAVRQRLVDHAPVVETAMRIPGGDVRHRAYAVRTPSGADAVVVEVENATPVPFALAFAVRPYGLTGAGPVHDLALSGSTITVDGRVAVVLPRPPNRTAASTRAGGDCAADVVTGRAGADASFAVRCSAGGAQATVIYPLPHTATLRVVLPLGGPEPLDVEALDPARQPSAAQVAAGWQAQTAAGARFDLPAGRVADAVEANRRFLLLAAGGFERAGAPVLDRAAVVGALDRWGYAHDAGALLAALASVDDDGALVPPSDRHDAEGAALVATADHVRLDEDDDLLDALRVPVVQAAATIRRAAGGSRLRRRSALGLLPAGAQPAWASPGRAYRDDLWAVAGLRGAADLLARAGDHGPASAVGRDAEALWQSLPESFQPTTSASPNLATGPEPTGDDGELAAVAHLAACQPLGLLAPSHPLVAASVDAVRRRADPVGGVRQPRDASRCAAELTLDLAAVELAANDPRALERLDQVVGQASATWTWPESIDAPSGQCVDGAGHHLPTAATFLRVVRDLCVRDDADGLVLLSVVPPTWLGQSIDVHGAPTRFGALSYAVRWHGERPAVLWELDPHDEVTTVRLRAPGLDPAWVGDGLRGDALLAAPGARA